MDGNDRIIPGNPISHSEAEHIGNALGIEGATPEQVVEVTQSPDYLDAFLAGLLRTGEGYIVLAINGVGDIVLSTEQPSKSKHGFDEVTHEGLLTGVITASSDSEITLVNYGSVLFDSGDVDEGIDETVAFRTGSIDTRVASDGNIVTGMAIKDAETKTPNMLVTLSDPISQVYAVFQR